MPPQTRAVPPIAGQGSAVARKTLLRHCRTKMPQRKVRLCPWSRSRPRSAIVPGGHTPANTHAVGPCELYPSRAGAPEVTAWSQATAEALNKVGMPCGALFLQASGHAERIRFKRRLRRL